MEAIYPEIVEKALIEYGIPEEEVELNIDILNFSLIAYL